MHERHHFLIIIQDCFGIDHTALIKVYGRIDGKEEDIRLCLLLIGGYHFLETLILGLRVILEIVDDISALVVHCGHGIF